MKRQEELRVFREFFATLASFIVEDNLRGLHLVRSGCLSAVVALKNRLLMRFYDSLGH